MGALARMADHAPSPAYGRAVAEAVAERLPELRSAADQVTAVIHHVETAVVEVCRTFQDIAARYHETSSGDSAETRSEVSELLARTRGTLSTLLGDLVESSNAFLGTVADLDHLEQGMRRIERLLAKVDGVASQTRILALNAGIAAARVGDRGREFAVVASEMKKLAVASQETSVGIRKIVQEVRDATTTTCTALRAMAERDLKEVDVQRRSVDDTIARLSAAHEELRAELQASAVRDAAIARDVSAAVVALQFQDVVGQRLGRVVATLGEVCAVLSAALPGELRIRLAVAAPPRPDSSGEPATTGDIELF